MRSALLVMLIIAPVMIRGSQLSTRKLNCNEITAENSIESFDVEFYLSTFEKQNPAKISTKSNINKFLNQRRFNPYLRTAVVVHGFLNSHGSSWVERMTEELHKFERMNIILVDWSDAFDFPFVYRSAALSTRKAANETSNLLKKMAVDFKFPLQNWTYLHFIGHSLGAHVVGQAARLLKTSKDYPTVHRITGLDPANPCFNDIKVAFRLKKTDAKFVDIIHTNSAPGLNPNFGLYDKVGHVDFYINGGNNQPSCSTKFLPSNIPFLSDPGDLIEDLENFVENNLINVIGLFSTNLSKIDTRKIVANFLDNDYNMICSHLQAPEFFIQSMDQKNGMWASPTTLPIKVNELLKCDNRKCVNNKKCIKMGMALRGLVEEGSYYVDTTETKINCKKLETKS